MNQQCGVMGSRNENSEFKVCEINYSEFQRFRELKTSAIKGL
jgi:hypothetical protein